jgi:hypothetical protein
MILQQKKIVSALLMAGSLSSHIADAGHCDQINHHAHTFQRLSICSSLASLLPQLDHLQMSRAALQAEKVKGQVQNYRNESLKNDLAQKTGKRIHEKKPNPEVILAIEVYESKKNLVELLTSGDESETRIGGEVLLRWMMARLPWTFEKGKRQYLAPKIRRFASTVRGKSEAEFLKLYGWFESEVRMNKRFFKNGAPSLAKKSRPWRSGLTEKELHQSNFVEDGFVESSSWKLNDFQDLNYTAFELNTHDEGGDNNAVEDQDASGHQSDEEQSASSDDAAALDLASIPSLDDEAQEDDTSDQDSISDIVYLSDLEEEERKVQKSQLQIHSTDDDSEYENQIDRFEDSVYSKMERRRSRK